MAQRDVRNRLRIQRENEDRGLRDCLSTPAGRAFIWWLYKHAMMQRDAVITTSGDASALMTFRAIGKQAVGLELANRCKLVDHKNWLLTLAENDEALDDGRAQDKHDDQEPDQ